tara:strand:+ start:288 stop:530 length:243 start_codon:yes stop_codon:yes gene_type:complete
MIIPIKCFTCGNVIADKYRYFLQKSLEIKMKEANEESDVDKVKYLTEKTSEKTAEAKVLDEINLTKMCCRRHMLTHVDID